MTDQPPLVSEQANSVELVYQTVQAPLLAPANSPIHVYLISLRGVVHMYHRTITPTRQFMFWTNKIPTAGAARFLPRSLSDGLQVLCVML